VSNYFFSSFSSSISSPRPKFYHFKKDLLTLEQRDNKPILCFGIGLTAISCPQPRTQRQENPSATTNGTNS
jgi:hypothetical protein